MIKNMTIQYARLAGIIEGKAWRLAAILHNFTGTHKAVLIRCAVIFLAIKIGLILLATISATVFMASTATQKISEEMTRTQALLFSTPLTLIMLLKLYFIFRALMAYGGSRKILVAAFHALLLKGGQGLRQIENSLPAVVPQLSPERAVRR